MLALHCMTPSERALDPAAFLTGLVRSALRGFQDLVAFPLAAIEARSPAQFFAGLGLGSASLVRNLSGDARTRPMHELAKAPTRNQGQSVQNAPHTEFCNTMRTIGQQESDNSRSVLHETKHH